MLLFLKKRDYQMIFILDYLNNLQKLHIFRQKKDSVFSSKALFLIILHFYLGFFCLNLDQNIFEI